MFRSWCQADGEEKTRAYQKIDPDDHEASGYLALSLLMQGAEEKAIPHLKLADEQSPLIRPWIIPFDQLSTARDADEIGHPAGSLSRSRFPDNLPYPGWPIVIDPSSGKSRPACVSGFPLAKASDGD